MANATRLIMAAVFFTVALASAFGQPVDVTQKPEPVPFPQWRPVGQTDFLEHYTVDFTSPVVTDYPENNHVKLDVYVPRHRTGPIPVVLVLHYWGATETTLEVAMAEALANRGMAAVIMPLPYHLSRTPDGKRSGELTVVADVGSLSQNMVQSVQDVRRTVDFIESRPEFDRTKIGIVGTSMGALVSSMSFAVEPRFAAATFLLGGADLAHVMWNSSRVVQQRDRLRSVGYTEDSLREALASIESLNYLDPNDRRPSYLIRARHDTVIPPQSSQRLQDALGNPQVLYLETGHYGGILVQQKLSRTTASFFAETFSGRDFVAPAEFYSPTIRVGFGVDPEHGFQFSIGMDVWRLNAESDAFGSLFLTPYGVRGFLGARLGRDVALGAVILPRKTTFGILWSTVF